MLESQLDQITYFHISPIDIYNIALSSCAVNGLFVKDTPKRARRLCFHDVLSSSWLPLLIWWLLGLQNAPIGQIAICISRDHDDFFFFETMLCNLSWSDKNDEAFDNSLGSYVARCAPYFEKRIQFQVEKNLALKSSLLAWFFPIWLLAGLHHPLSIASSQDFSG